MKSTIQLLILTVFLCLNMINSATAQSGWSTSRHYASRGQAKIESTYRSVWNPQYGVYQNVRYCRKLQWYQEWYSGRVYYWQHNSYTGQYYWASKWEEGTFWYCNWSGWYVC